MASIKKDSPTDTDANTPAQCCVANLHGDRKRESLQRAHAMGAGALIGTVNLEHAGTALCHCTLHTLKKGLYCKADSPTSKPTHLQNA